MIWPVCIPANACPVWGLPSGLDRMLAAMEELQLLPKTTAVASVFVVQFDDVVSRTVTGSWQCGYGGPGWAWRSMPEPKKLAAQLKYAAQQGFHVAIIAGSNEFATGSCQVKFLESRSTREVSLDGDEFERTVAQAIP